VVKVRRGAQKNKGNLEVTRTRTRTKRQRRVNVCALKKGVGWVEVSVDCGEVEGNVIKNIYLF
jgi:hypothetical protein